MSPFYVDRDRYVQLDNGRQLFVYKGCYPRECEHGHNASLQCREFCPYGYESDSSCVTRRKKDASAQKERTFSCSNPVNIKIQVSSTSSDSYAKWNITHPNDDRDYRL